MSEKDKKKIAEKLKKVVCGNRTNASKADMRKFEKGLNDLAGGIAADIAETISESSKEDRCADGKAQSRTPSPET